MATIRIRNRLTHPKRVDEMIVSDDEMTKVDAANEWFGAAYHSLMTTYTAKLQAQIEEMRRETADLKQRSQ